VTDQGCGFRCLGRHDPIAASQHLAQAVALITEARRAADPDWRRLLLERAQTEYALAQGKADAAQANAKEAIPHLQQNLDPSHPLTVIAGKLAAGATT
jgi:hypothetical protein